MREASTTCNNCGLPKHGFYPPPEGYCKRVTCLSTSQIANTTCEHCQETVVKDNYDIHMEEKHAEIENERIAKLNEMTGMDLEVAPIPKLQISNTIRKGCPRCLYVYKERIRHYCLDCWKEVTN